MIKGTLIDARDGQLADLAEVLDRLPPRDMWVGHYLDYPDLDPLEPARTIINSNDYLFYGVAFPDSQLLNIGSPQQGIPPNQQLDGIVTSYKNAILVSIRVTSLAAPGVAIRIYDNFTKVDFFQGEFIDANTVGEYDSLPDNTLPAIDTTLNPPGFIFQPYYFPCPVPVGGDGSLGVSVINLSSNYNVAQVFFNFAIPAS
jgi:hypothetical protein